MLRSGLNLEMNRNILDTRSTAQTQSNARSDFEYRGQMIEYFEMIIDSCM